MHQFRYSLAFFYCFIGLTLTAQTIIHLDGKELQQPLFEQIEYAVEVGCPSFDIDRVTSLDFKPFAQRGYYAGISLYWFFKGKNKPHIPHLTGIQVISGIAISSDLFRKKISTVAPNP